MCFAFVKLLFAFKSHMAFTSALFGVFGVWQLVLQYRGNHVPVKRNKTDSVYFIVQLLVSDITNNSLYFVFVGSVNKT